MSNPKHTIHEDWASASSVFDLIAQTVSGKNLSRINDAQTRYDVIDQLIRAVFGWQMGQVFVGEFTKGKDGYMFIYEARMHQAGLNP